MIKFSSKFACKISGITLKQLNDAIYLKHLRCVPETHKGKTRTFDENELLMLMVYGALLRIGGLNYRRAGELSCELLRKLKVKGDKCEAVRLYFARGKPNAIMVYNNGKHDDEPERDEYNEFLDITLHLDYMRNSINKAIDGETPIVYGGG